MLTKWPWEELGSPSYPQENGIPGDHSSVSTVVQICHAGLCYCGVFAGIMGSNDTSIGIGASIPVFSQCSTERNSKMQLSVL